MNPTKKAIRQAMLERRNALSAEEAATRSEQIQEHVLRSAAFQKARCVALYAAFDQEVRTERLLREAVRQGKQAAFPRMKGRGPEMDFGEVRDQKEMVLSFFGFPEPAPSAPVVALPAIDLMVVPGLAFDREGFRVGFGAGCYDRVLAALRPEAGTCGIAYDFQVIDQVPRAAHDLAVKLLVSEGGFIPIGRNR